MAPTVHHGDCLEVLRGLPSDSLDACVTDPPYGLSFMGKGWDYDVPSVDIWREVFRVLKPGAHLLAFAGTRTQHRMAVNIEDAGFEIRDLIMWCYGSGFPKSHNLKDEWQGWGTALKPALEPVTVARKPLIGTVAENVQTHGTGAFNIDGCRVATDDKLGGGMVSMGRPKASEGWDRPWMHDPEVTERKKIEAAEKVAFAEKLGRWPANLIHDGSEEVLAGFPETGPSKAAARGIQQRHDVSSPETARPKAGTNTVRGHSDAGGSAARFFYCPKASKSDRDEGLEGFEPLKTNDGRKVDADNAYQRGATTRANHHPTVKPTDLMRYLCRLVTPPGGVVLDPFMGSGSTGKAATLEGFAFVGIEREAEYIEIARARIEHVKAPDRSGEKQAGVGLAKQNQEQPDAY